MLKKHLLLCLSIISFSSKAQDLISPDSFLGYELGTVFSRHHQVVDYYKYLGLNSNWVKIKSYGKTNEGRLLQLAFISSPENLKDIEKIRKNIS